MLKAISLIVAVAQVLFPTAPPGVDRSNAYARAAGNDKPLAVMVGNRVFKTQWPAQVLSVYADLANDSDVIGLRISGKHFHGVMRASELSNEIADLATQTMTVDPRIEEVDLWLTLPLDLTKDVVVKSDVNTPSWKTVFSISVRRGETRGQILKRIAKGTGVYWDQEWRRAAVK
ncbi:MAG TPA: hypothetical protein VFL13_09845 [Candidatus Baltobacteraceae bacterium]|nr:hypothetical protein [Candidatus Baltobacteraceae bacterium]